MSSDAATTDPAAEQDPCCGTAEAAAAAAACCAPAAKVEAVADGAGCCGPTGEAGTQDAGCCGPATTVISSIELLPTPAARPAAVVERRPADLPVVVIGAGPVGLAAAAHLHEQGVPFLVLEAGDQVGASVRQWAHVGLFSPWRYDIDAAARRLLDDAGWAAPGDDDLPTGGQFVEDYLQPLGAWVSNASVGVVGR